MQINRRNEAEFDRILAQELASRTKLSDLPSIQVQAWRDYERQKFWAPGRHPPPASMGYNLWDVAVRGVPFSYRVLTDSYFARFEGYNSSTAPRGVLANMASYIGFRYLRGLECIECRLKGADLQQFRKERQQFRRAWEAQADDAHGINNKGQNSAAVLQCVLLYSNELLDLCPWLERTGHTQGAAILKASATLPA